MYAFLFLLLLALAWLVHGPQDQLEAYPALAAGAFLAIRVCAGIVFALGAAFRSSLVAAVGGFGGVFALSGAGFAGAAMALPGPGPVGVAVDEGEALAPPAPPFGDIEGQRPEPLRLAMGTHNLSPALAFLALHAGKEIVFLQGEFGPVAAQEQKEVLRLPLGEAALRVVGVAFGCLAAGLLLAWWRFARAEVLG